MDVRSAHFYSRNEARPYPVDSTRDPISVGGARLPSHVITDLTLMVPSTLGRYPFLASLTVTDRIVTLTIQGSDQPGSADGLVPLAVFTQQQPVEEGRHLALEPQMEGVGGWIVLGSGVHEPFSGRFPGPQATLLAPRAARTYEMPPVRDIGRLGSAQPLTGLVRLSARPPIEIVGEDRDLAGSVRETAVIRLSRVAGSSSSLRTAAGEPDVFEEMAGCLAHPESGNCAAGPAIETINGVQPDCDGVIRIRLEGAEAWCGDESNRVGIGMDTDLSEVCSENRLPDQDGRLPSDEDGSCPPEST